MWLSDCPISREGLTPCILISPVRIIELRVEPRWWELYYYNTLLQYIYSVAVWRSPVVSENAMTQSCGMRAVQTGGLDWDLEQFVCSVFTFTGSTLPQPQPGLSQGQILPQILTAHTLHRLEATLQCRDAGYIIFIFMVQYVYICLYGTTCGFICVKMLINSNWPNFM